MKEMNLFIDSRINFYFRRENREYKEKTFAKDITSLLISIGIT